MTLQSWRDVPLDVDGVLSLQDHQRACVDRAACWICPRDDGRPVTLEGEPVPTPRPTNRRTRGARG